MKSLKDAWLYVILTGKGERFSAPTNEKSAAKNYVSYVAMWFKKKSSNRFGKPSIPRLASFRSKP
jgi:hypothetical protein